MSLFVDTSVGYAAADSSDSSNARAKRAASFDDDFAIYRFGPNRRRAFTIVR